MISELHPMGGTQNKWCGPAKFHALATPSSGPPFSLSEEGNEFGEESSNPTMVTAAIYKSFLLLLQRALDWYAVGQCDTAGPRRGLHGAGEPQKVS